MLCTKFLSIEYHLWVKLLIHEQNCKYLRNSRLFAINSNIVHFIWVCTIKVFSFCDENIINRVVEDKK